jgi:hypothetical protein
MKNKIVIYRYSKIQRHFLFLGNAGNCQVEEADWVTKPNGEPG